MQQLMSDPAMNDPNGEFMRSLRDLNSLMKRWEDEGCGNPPHLGVEVEEYVDLMDKIIDQEDRHHQVSAPGIGATGLDIDVGVNTRFGHEIALQEANPIMSSIGYGLAVTGTGLMAIGSMAVVAGGI